MLKFEQNIGASQHYMLGSVLEEMKVSPSQLYNEVESLKKTLSDDDLPAAETWKKRQELCHLLESLLLIDLDFALDKKVEQDLWSFVFRNPIAACQSKAKEQKKADPNCSKNQLTTLLETASGFYLQLLQKLSCAYDIDLPCHPRDSVYGLIKEWIGRHPVANKPRKSSLFYICQHCLVHLGDIARYRGQSLQAENFYRHAVDLVPSNGQPYNQLALLEAASGEKLSTVFFHMRSLAVPHPFPLAANNLQTLFSKIPLDGTATEGKPKMTAFEYITVFLQFQATVHLTIDSQKIEKLVTHMIKCLPALVIAEKFETWQLVQMVAVCLFSIDHTWSADNVEKSLPASKGSPHVEELLANMLYAFLLPLHASPEPKETAIYYTLPAVKIILDWLLQDPKLLRRESLTSKPQLWPALCKLLNDLDLISLESHDTKKFEHIPLPEDWDLQCFLPLKESQKHLKFNLNAETPSDEESVWLRAVRLCKLGESLTEEGKCGLVLLSSSHIDGRRLFKAGHQAEAVVEQFLKQIHELTISSSPVSVSSQQPESTFHANGNGPIDHAHPSLRLKTHLDCVPQQEVRFKLDDIQQRKEKLEVERDEKSERRNKELIYSNRDKRIGKNVAMQAILQQRAAQNSSNMLTRTSDFGKESNLDVTIRQPTRSLSHLDSSHHVRANPERNCITPQAVSEVNMNRNHLQYNADQYNHVQAQQLKAHESLSSVDRRESWMQSLKIHQNAIPSVTQILRGNSLNNYLQNSLSHIVQPSTSDFAYHQGQVQPQPQIQPHSLVNRQMASPSQAFLQNNPNMIWNYMNFMASCQQNRSANTSTPNPQILMQVNSEQHRSQNSQLHQQPQYFVMNNHLQKIPSIEPGIQQNTLHHYRNSGDDACVIPRSDIFRDQIHDQLNCQSRSTNMWSRDIGATDVIQNSGSQTQVVGRAVGQAVHLTQQVQDSGNGNSAGTSTGHLDVGSNTYSLFNSPWPSGLSVHRTTKENQHSGAVDSVLMPSRIQSLWSGAGPSPLERLLEQQKHGRDNSAL